MSSTPDASADPAAVGAGADAAAPAEPAPRVRAPRSSRRATRPGAVGADPAPQLPRRVASAPPTLAAEDAPRSWGDPSDSNDDRLRRDKPPHWG